MKSTIHLIPTGIGNLPYEYWLPQKTQELVSKIKIFIVENKKTARSFLKSINTIHPIKNIEIYDISNLKSSKEINSLLKRLEYDNDIAIISEAGCPAIADPGSLIVYEAHSMGLYVKPHTGPSSVILSLMASGINGQNFCFRGYLPINKINRISTLLTWENESYNKKQTQIFIETPYRNEHIFKSILEELKSTTILCIARHIFSENEYIKTFTIGKWKTMEHPKLHKMPTIFLFLAQ